MVRTELEERVSVLVAPRNETDAVLTTSAACAAENTKSAHAMISRAALRVFLSGNGCIGIRHAGGVLSELLVDFHAEGCDGLLGRVERADVEF